ncbi:MAG: trimethylamine methyltransferase family protein, partial [Acidimicrobiia bacterium]|nr:trimethylamine methyltransferase family protein [Acidimicrobiia bacterium]
MTDAAQTRRRRGGRRRDSRTDGDNGHGPAPVEQPPAAQPRRSMAPAELLSADQIEAVHQASMTVLRDTGMDVLNAEARRLLADAGATVD